MRFASLLVLLLTCLSALFGDYSIVFVHIGNEVPSYADIAISQARLFNPNARIILLSSDTGLQRFHSLANLEKIELCSYDHLPQTALHKDYQKQCAEPSAFWRYTSERFLYLWDLMKAWSLENVYHLENDIMLYADLEPLLPEFQQRYPGIGATFDNDARCIPGFVWIANGIAMKDLAKYFTQKAPLRLNDMQVIGSYRNERTPQSIDHLPIIMPEYARVHALISPHHHTTTRPESYSNHSQTFQAIFDAAAIGQFLGGIDPIHKNSQPGFINESCLFNPSLLQYEWIMDELGRLVPYALFEGSRYKITNLHIHSKNLRPFQSR